MKFLNAGMLQKTFLHIQSSNSYLHVCLHIVSFFVDDVSVPGEVVCKLFKANFTLAFAWNIMGP